METAARISHTSALILQTIRSGYVYGFDIMDVTGLPSGTIYPALRRLEKESLVSGDWEDSKIALAPGPPATPLLQAYAPGQRCADECGGTLSSSGQAGSGRKGSAPIAREMLWSLILKSDS